MKIYIRRLKEVNGVWFDIVKKKGFRYESLIAPYAVDYPFIKMFQDNGFEILDADFEINKMVREN